MERLMEYDGTFELAFLADDERVRSAGLGDATINVESPRGNVRLQVGDWLARNDDGSLTGLKPPQQRAEAAIEGKLWQNRFGQRKFTS